MLSLKEQQRRLVITVVNYDLKKMWASHPLINDLRQKVAACLPKNVLCDPQDLEHQILFRLTTFDPKDINDELIQFVVKEQLTIVQDRLEKLNVDLEYLFRGLSDKYQDLNISDRLQLCWKNEQLVAKNNRRSFNIEFQTVHDDRIVSLFSNELHYIHQDRPKGETFGFYFSGDEIPWAIETTEPSVIAKQYKRDALLANGIDPNKAIELTRFYTLPGAPTNAISLMDGLVAKYYKSKGMEALFTTTMPMYSKTKSATIAGGINKPLLVKNLRHKFIPVNIKDKTLYRHVTTVPEDHEETEVIKTHPKFPTMLVVEVFRTINTPSLKPLPIFEDGSKVVYVIQRGHSQIEQEIKLKVTNISATLQKIRNVATYKNTEYIRDIVYGVKDNKKKIRLRVRDDFESQSLNVIHKYRVSVQDGIKKEVEEMIYNGNSFEDALSAISLHGDFKEENSYEKIRVVFSAESNTEITLDVYPFGCWMEIEGVPEKIRHIASNLGFSQKDYINISADDVYLDWIKKHNLPEMWDVRFGLVGKK